MKLLRLILPITLFILSGVLAYIIDEVKIGSFILFFIIYLLLLFSMSICPITLIWALGGFDD